MTYKQKGIEFGEGTGGKTINKKFTDHTRGSVKGGGGEGSKASGMLIPTYDGSKGPVKRSSMLKANN